MGPNLTQLRLETRKLNVSGCIQIDGIQYRIPGTDAGTDVDVLIEEERIAVFLHGQCITELNRTADAYEASTFKYRQKEIWESGNVRSSSGHWMILISKHSCLLMRSKLGNGLNSNESGKLKTYYFWDLPVSERLILRLLLDD